jgi:hypothetical protein
MAVAWLPNRATFFGRAFTSCQMASASVAI